MSDPTQNFKINLNQNLWGLTISLIALGCSEKYQLSDLEIISVVLAVVMGVSVIITTFAYTYKYCKRKWD